MSKEDIRQVVYGFNRIARNGPPCASCKFWIPRIETDCGELVLRFCSAEDTFQDFSCFEPKKEVER